jgi:RES domain-containing protein
VPSAWRLTKTKHLAEAFSGEGARLYGGRWNSAGMRAVYVSETLALAALEVLVHLQAARPLGSYSCIPVDVDPSLVESLDIAGLPPNWSDWPVSADVVAIGDRWLQEGRSAVLRVPSTIIPTESNFVLNPLHHEFNRITTGPARPFAFDPRLSKMHPQLSAGVERNRSSRAAARPQAPAL